MKSSGDRRPSTAQPRAQTWLLAVERIGNRLPDPALLFVWLLGIVAVTSAVLSTVRFSEADPRTGQPLTVVSLLTGEHAVRFLTQSVQAFATFPAVGVVLVAILGVGVAEHVGLIDAGIRGLLSLVKRSWVCPLLIVTGLVSHTAADAGYVLVIPVGAIVFMRAGRHPLAGIAAAFAGVSGGFCANFLPGPVDVMLQGLSQAAGQVFDPALRLNPLNNWYFSAASGLLIVGVGWFLTDRVIEPGLWRNHPASERPAAPVDSPLSARERKALVAAMVAMVSSALLLAVLALPKASPWRAPDGSLVGSNSPLLQSVVPLIFVLFLLPAVAYGLVARSIRSHRDVIAAMSKSVSSLSYFLVLAFFAAQFISAFSTSNLGTLLAVKGALWISQLAIPVTVTIALVVLITAGVNIVVGSASAKWALLAPILIPILMRAGVSPDFVQAAYRIGDSTMNIITPLNPYFPLIVTLCQRYVPRAGVGTVLALMAPYAVVFLVVWTVFLIVYWRLGLPLGIGASYEYVPQ